jgi:electron transport complex protein RnfC
MRGGLNLIAHKEQSTALAIETMAPPAIAVLELTELDAPMTAIVETGDLVRFGQPLARTALASIHASVSGRVVSKTSAGEHLTIAIENDGNDTPDESLQPIEDFTALAPDALRARIELAGICGLGGACFPTATKLSAAAQRAAPLLIVNGAECEPFITCDDRLMREHADDIVFGVQVLLHAISGTEAIVAVETNKPAALAAMRAAAKALNDQRIRVRAIPTFYPAGGERQLITALTEKEVPSGGVPPDIGILCQNVGTAAAVARLIRTGEPLLSRIVTVTGAGVQQPRNLRARFGTPVAMLIEACGGYVGQVERLIMGGSMMGVALASDEVSVSAATNCIIAATRIDLQPAGREMPCIRCGACSMVCPANLLPQQLVRYARLNDRPALHELGLRDCIECGCCDFVCPSQIPLASTFIAAKRAT